MFSDFGDFDIVDESPTRDREDRLRRAFEKSKESYAKELVVTEPKWYEPPEIPPPTKLLVRNIDYHLNDLYLNGRYAEALPLALSQLESEEGNVGKDGREYQLLDTCIRLALKQNESDLAGRLAEKGMAKDSHQPGLASTCAEGFLACSKPRLALNAVLSAISQRGKLSVLMSQLYRSLEALRNDPECDLEALGCILHSTWEHPSSTGPVYLKESEARTWAEACGISGPDREHLVGLIGQNNSGDIEVNEGKSVKAL